MIEFGNTEYEVMVELKGSYFDEVFGEEVGRYVQPCETEEEAREFIEKVKFEGEVKEIELYRVTKEYQQIEI